MNIGRRGFMGTVAGILGALLVPVKAIASTFKRQKDFIESREDQEVLPGHLLCVRPAKGTLSWTVQLVEGTLVRVRDWEGPRGTGMLLKRLEFCRYAGRSLIFIENESELPASVSVIFEGRRTE